MEQKSKGKNIADEMREKCMMVWLKYKAGEITYAQFEEEMRKLQGELTQSKTG